MELAPTGWLSVMRLVTASAVLLFIPGWLVQSLVLSVSPVTFIFRIVLSFSLSVASIAVFGVVAHFTGGSLGTVQILAVIWLAGLVGFWAWRFHRKRVALFPLPRFSSDNSIVPMLVLLFAVSCAGLALYGGGWFSDRADGFYHLAAIRRQIDVGTPLPQGLFYVYNTPFRGLNPTAGSWHLVLALLSLWSGIDITWIWRYLPVLMAPLLVFSFYSFALFLCKKPWLALLGTWLQFILYDKLDFRASPYPNQAGFILLWCAWTLTWLYVDSGKLTQAAMVGWLVVAMASWHLLLAEFFFVALALYLLLRSVAIWLAREKWWADLDVRRLCYIVVSTLILGVPILVYRIVVGGLPHTSDWQRWLSISPWPTFRSSLSLGYGFSIIGPFQLYKVDPKWRFAPFRFAVPLFSYLATVFMIPYCLKRQRAVLFMAATVSVVPLVLLNPFLITFLQDKVLDIAIIRLVLLPPYGLILGWLFWEQVGCWNRSVRTMPSWRTWRFSELIRVIKMMAAGALLALAAYVLLQQGLDNLRDLYDPASQHVYSLRATRERMRLSDQPAYAFLNRHSEPDVVVASDPESSYYLGGLTGRSVIVGLEGHYPPATGPSHWERERDSLSILDPGIGLDQTIKLLDKYGVCLIWVDSETQSPEPALVRRKFEGAPDLFDKTYEDSQATIYLYLNHRVGCLK